MALNDNNTSTKFIDDGDKYGDDIQSPLSPGGVAAKGEVPEPEASVMVTAVNITLNVIGGGLLAIPVSFDQTSLIPGIILLICMASLSIFSMILLTLCAQKTKRYSYKDLLQYAYSEKAGKAFEGVLAFYTYGILVGFGRIVCDTMPKVSKGFFHSTGFTASPLFWILISGVFFFILSSMKSLSALKYSSIVGFVTIIYLGLMVIIRFFDGSYREVGHESIVAPDVQYFDMSIGFFQAIPVMSTSFSCHYNIPVFYGELVDRSPRRMAKAISMFALFAVPFYLIVGTLAMLTFGHHRIDAANGDLMNNFRQDDTAFNVARLGFYIQFLASFPLVCLACRRATNVLLFGHAIQSQMKYIIEAFCLVSTACTIAYFVPSIDDVFSINGAIFGLAIVVTIPCLMYIKIFAVDPEQEAEAYADVVHFEDPDIGYIERKLKNLSKYPSKTLHLLCRIFFVVGIAAGVISLAVTILHIAGVKMV